MSEAVFRDRSQAGQCLAEALAQHANRDDVIVFGLSRGGVPVAYEVAEKLHAPLDVIVVGKLGVPGYEELAMGAIASGGVQIVHEAVMQAMGVSRGSLKKTVAAQSKKLQRREVASRGREGLPEVKDKNVILVDDGIATGSTVRAAVRALRHAEPRQINIAVPVASAASVAMLKPFVDDFIALVVPAKFQAVSQWYGNFPETSDADVRQWLVKAASREPAGTVDPEYPTPFSNECSA